MNDTPTSPAPDAGGASPAPDVASTPTPDTVSPAPDSGVEFAGLGQDFDDLDVEVSLSSESEAGGVKPPGAPKEEPSKSPEPAIAAKPEPAKVEPPKTPVVAPPTEGQKEPQPAAASPPSEPRTLVEQLNQHRDDILGELAKSRFAWDAGEQKAFTEALETDASKALVDWVPKLMARMYYESATMTLNHINQFVPALIGNYTKLMDQQKAAETEFFKQFPQLSRDKHWNDIVQFSAAFGKQPGITQQDLLAMVGAAAMAKHKLPMTAPATANGGQPPPRKPMTPAFVPAAAGGASPVRVTTESESPFEGLGGNYDE